MSSADDILAKARMLCCASCGKSGVGDVKLEECAGCKKYVIYCSDACKEDHWPEHEEKCKEYHAAYQAAELRDEILFRQPESSHYGDCPICCLPLPIYPRQTFIYSCCGKTICNGCRYADGLRQRRENMRVETCPFCRHPLATTDEEADANLMKRIEANDPDAMRQMGAQHAKRKENDDAFKYLTKAAELGNADAHLMLAGWYRTGEVVEKDKSMELYHLQEASIAGHPEARHELALCEGMSGWVERAFKHWIIAASLGNDDSIKALKTCYKDGKISKEDFAGALRAHHAAANAMKSPQREAAQKFLDEHATSGRFR